MGIKITAHLLSSPVVMDDWSPSIDGILEWSILDRLGLLQPNLTREECEKNAPIIAENMPLEKGEISGNWYWKCSSPCYFYEIEYTTQINKRWSPIEDGNPPEWGKRKQKWDSQSGPDKAYRLPLFERVISQIDWYLVGDIDRILDLLNSIKTIGKKGSYGNGQVLKWEAKEIGSDWHLWGPNGELMRPIPVGAIDRPTSFAIKQWGIRPPGRLHQIRCAMPTNTVQPRNDAVSS